VHEVMIIGAGPAGMTAAVYAARKRLKTLLVSKDIGGQAIWASKIDNYMGYHRYPHRSRRWRWSAFQSQHRAFLAF